MNWKSRRRFAYWQKIQGQIGREIVSGHWDEVDRLKAKLARKYPEFADSPTDDFAGDFHTHCDGSVHLGMSHDPGEPGSGDVS